MKYLLDDISSGGNWSDWRLSPAPSYFPDLVIYALAYSVSNLAPVQIILTTATQAIIVTLLSIALTRQLNPNTPRAAKLAIMALTLLCLITTSQYTLESSIGIFFGSNNIQTPTMISSLALLWLALSLTEKKSATKATAFLLIGVLGYISSAVFIICLSLPFIATLTIVVTRSKISGSDKNLKKYIFILLLFVASQAIGYALSNAITFNSPLDGRIPISFDGAKYSAMQFLKATQFIFDPSTPTAFFTALIFFCAFIYALSKGGKLLFILFKYNKANPTSIQEQLICLFFLLTTASSFFGAIISGGFMDKFGYRYFETFIVLSAIISIHFINKSLSEKTIDFAPTFIATISALVTISSIFSLEHHRSLPFSELLEYGAFKDQEQSTANCLDNLIRSGVPLKAGVADYWMSRGVMFYTKNNIFINQSTDQLHPYFWISSIGPIRQPEKYNASEYNFVIANNVRCPP